MKPWSLVIGLQIGEDALSHRLSHRPASVWPAGLS